MDIVVGSVGRYSDLSPTITVGLKSTSTAVGGAERDKRRALGGRVLAFFAALDLGGSCVLLYRGRWVVVNTGELIFFIFQIILGMLA